MMPTLDDARLVLQEKFGYDDFRPGQADIISAILGGRDALAVMPTGAGKSICYQVPAVLMDGLTLVVSPPISLSLTGAGPVEAPGGFEPRPPTRMIAKSIPCAFTRAQSISSLYVDTSTPTAALFTPFSSK